MPKYVELSIDGVIHESEIFGVAMPQKDNATKEEEQSDHE